MLLLSKHDKHYLTFSTAALKNIWIFLSGSHKKSKVFVDQPKSVGIMSKGLTDICTGIDLYQT